MNRRRFLKQLLSAAAVGIVAPADFLGRSQVSIPTFIGNVTRVVPTTAPDFTYTVMDEARNEILRSTGLHPNTIIMGNDAFRALRSSHWRIPIKTYTTYWGNNDLVTSEITTASSPLSFTNTTKHKTPTSIRNSFNSLIDIRTETIS